MLFHSFFSLLPPPEPMAKPASAMITPIKATPIQTKKYSGAESENKYPPIIPTSNNTAPTIIKIAVSVELETILINHFWHLKIFFTRLQNLKTKI